MASEIENKDGEVVNDLEIAKALQREYDREHRELASTRPR